MFNALMTKAVLLTATLAISYSSPAISSDVDSTKKSEIPVTYQDYFKERTDEPLVMLYEGQRAYETKDYDKALSWYLKASKYLLEPAVKNARHMILNNRGTYGNRDAVIEYLTYYGTGRADHFGDVYSQIYLGDYYSGARCVWNEYRINMYPSSCNEDELTVEKNQEKAYLWYSLAAKQGHVRGLFSTAMMDILGIGTPRNITKGLKLLERVAETGHANSAYLVGMIYKIGYWIDPNDTIAVKWLKRGADKGNTDAMVELADNYRRVVGVTMDAESSIEAALRLYQKIIDSPLTNVNEKALALYEKGMMQLTMQEVADPVSGVESLEKSVAISKDSYNQSQILALMKLATLVEIESQEEALDYLKVAENRLSDKSVMEQKEFAFVYQMIANIYASGDGDVPENQRLFSRYMKKFHALRATEEMVIPVDNELFGYGAFKF